MERFKTYLIKINPNKEEADEIKQRVRDNDGYCPCAIEKNESTKCMCEDFRKYTEEGYCHCGLYFKEKAQRS